MTYAESIIGQIDRQDRELRSLLAKLDDAPIRSRDDSAWSAREVLLHLLGATRRSVDDLRAALGESTQFERQAGGEYTDVPGLATAADVAGELLRALDTMRELVRDRSDGALARSISVSIGEADPVSVPIGLVLRAGLTTHFDEHVGQLRGALGPPGDA